MIDLLKTTHILHFRIPSCSNGHITCAACKRYYLLRLLTTFRLFVSLVMQKCKHRDQTNIAVRTLHLFF